MPKRKDLKKILVVGAGPIIIGQACEFDYSGTQACKALRDEGYKVILINSNPATIMTDPNIADATYIEPVDWQTLEKIIEKEKPDAILPTMGGQTGLNVSLSYIFRFLDTSLNVRNEAAFWDFLWVYGLIVLVALPVISLYRFTRLKFGRYWREWLTNNFIERYFANRAFYLLDSNAQNSDIDNPDQRISEDIKNFTMVTLSFLIDILQAILTVTAFSAILWSISKTLTIGLLVYVGLGTWVAIYTGKKMIKIYYDQLRLEADFRYGMVHVRDNSESIAFYSGEKKEIKSVLKRLFRALKNYDLWIIWQSIVDLFQFSYSNLMRFPVYLLVAPLYFSGEIDFGTITQAWIAFFQVFGALSIAVSYTHLTLPTKRIV
mgnify:CR=1 FL=1